MTKNKKILKLLKPLKKYFMVSLLFFALLMLNNCGGGGGGSNSSVLDMMSANDIEITTLNSQNGMILGNVFLTLVETGKEEIILKSANSGDSGIYSFSKVKIGSYVVKASKAGYEDMSETVVVTNGPQKVTLRLKPSFPPDSISGMVKRSDTLAGIPDVTVEIKDSSPIIKAITDQTGSYVLNSVAPSGSGVYVLRASKAGYKSEERSNVVKLPNIALKNMDIVLQTSGSTDVLLPGKIIGIVRDNETKSPIENISVTLQDSNLPSCFSSAAGYYHIDSVPAGKQFIMTATETTTSKKYVPYSIQLPQLTSEQTMIQDIMMEPVKVPEVYYGWLIGTVLDSTTKNAISGATIELLGTSLYGVTSANGSFKINNITPGADYTGADYIILFSKSGYISKTIKKRIEKNENLIDIDANYPGAVMLQPTSSGQNYCSINGSVTDTDLKVGVPGVSVELYVPDTNSVTFSKVTTTTGANGEFVFTNVFIPTEKAVEGQNMTMVISRSDYVSMTITNLIKGGVTNAIDPEKTKITKLKGTITGNVVDADSGAAISGASVALANFNFGSVQNPAITAAATGAFTFANIPVGTYTLLVSASGYATEVKNGITLTNNGQTIGPFPIQLTRKYGTITGFVYIDTNGVAGYQTGAGGDTPISGITVTAISTGGTSTSTLATDMSKNDGSFTLNNLPLADIIIKTNEAGTTLNTNYSSRTDNYKVQQGYQIFNVELSQAKGNVSGTIYEDTNKNGQFDNEPLIAGAEVKVKQDAADITATSDAKGNFVLTGLKFGTITITASKEAYNSASKVEVLPQNSNLSNVYIGLFKGTGKIVGRVIDTTYETVQPGIGGVPVKLLGYSNFSTTTDSTGGYIFNNVPSSTGTATSKYTVVADGSSLGFTVATVDADAPASDGATSKVEDVKLSKNKRLVYGKIVDSVTKIGQKDIQVKIQGLEGTGFDVKTDNSGVYVFNSVPVNPSSSYSLGIADTQTINGYPRYKNRDDVSITVGNDTTPLKVQDIEVTPNLGKIRGTVYDSITGFPIKSSLFTSLEPIMVEISSFTPAVTGLVSMANGEFVLENIPAGSYTVKVKHNVTTSQKMFEEVNRTANVTSGQLADLGIIYVTLKTVTIKGKIKDKIVSDYKTTYPSTPEAFVSGAQVQAIIDDVAFNKTVTTGYDGSYTLTVPVYSSYRFKVTASGFIDFEEGSTSVAFPTPSSAHSQFFAIEPKVGNISGMVYLDSNANNYYDTGDTVKIKDAHVKYMSGDFKVKTYYRNVPFITSIESNSSFTISNIPTGNYYITIEPPSASLDSAYAQLNTTTWVDGSGNRIVNVQTNSTTPASPINMVVSKTSYPTGSISGTVLDETTLLPITGASITITSDHKNLPISTSTDGSGYFSVSNIVYYANETDTKETLTITAAKTSYRTDIPAPVVIKMARTPDGSQNLNDKSSMEVLLPSIKLRKGTGSLQGRVLDGQTNLPLSNVNVSVVGLSTTVLPTDANGVYTISDIPVGTYSLFYMKLNATSAPDPNYSTYTAQNIVLSEHGKIKSLDDVVLSTNFSSMKGYVYLEVNNINGYQAGQDKPLPDIKINATLGTTTATATSQPDGSYLISDLIFGRYTISYDVTGSTNPDKNNYTMSSYTLDISSKTQYVQDIRLMAKAGDLYGVIFDDINGNGIMDGSESGITGIRITPATTFGSFTPTPDFTTGEGGSYEFKNMNTVNDTLTIANNTNVKGYQTKVVRQTITAGQRTLLNIPMKRNTVNIYGRIVDIDTKNAVSNVSVSINGTSISTTTASDGRFTLSNVSINSTGNTIYDVYFDGFSLGYQTRSSSVTLSTTTGDYTFSPDIELSKSVRKVRGRIINPDLLPLSGATVRITGKYGASDPLASSGTDGWFVLDSVPVDLVNQTRIEATLTDYEIAFRNFILGVGNTVYDLSPSDIQLTSSNAKITGTVLDSLTGGPVSSPNFTITVGITQGTVARSTTVNPDGTFTLSDVKKGGPYDLYIRSGAGINQYFEDVSYRISSLSPGQSYSIGTKYIQLKTVAVKGTIYDSKVYSLALNANELSRAGVQNATVVAKYERYDHTYYQVTSNPTLSGGSFEVQLPPLLFDFNVSCTNFEQQTFPKKNINTYPNAYNGMDFQIKPNETTVYGNVYFDANENGYVDNNEQPIFTANGGVFQGLNTSLIVTYDYHSFTFDTPVSSNSSFTISHVPVAPDGQKTFIVYDKAFSGKIMPSFWRDSSGNNLVSVNITGTVPSLVNIAVSPAETQYATFNGQVYDDKIWNEGNTLYTGSPGYNRFNTNYQVQASVLVTSPGGYSQTVQTRPDGRFTIKVPGGNRYTFKYSATGYTDTQENLVQAVSGTSVNLTASLYPKYGTVTGTIYYDNNVNGVNSEPTDYNHLHEASEPPVTSVVGHPTTASNWGGITFNVTYSYRGLTFGTTSFDRTNSKYTIEKLPIGSYTNFKAQDVSSLSQWTGVGTEYDSRMFMDQIYTLDGKNPGTVTVSDSVTTANIDFAVMVWGGHVRGYRYMQSGTTPPEYTPGFFMSDWSSSANKPSAVIRGEDYWVGMGGDLNTIDGVAAPRKYALEMLDVKNGGTASGIKKVRFSDPQGLVNIMSYPIGNDPDIIIPPGNYILSMSGDIDLSAEPMISMPPNLDLVWAGWAKSPTGYYYKYGPTSGAPPTVITTLAKDRCKNVIYYYNGNDAANGIALKAGQTHVIKPFAN